MCTKDADMLDVQCSTLYSLRDSPLPQTEEQPIEQDNREGKPYIVAYLFEHRNWNRK